MAATSPSEMLEYYYTIGPLDDGTEYDTFAFTRCSTWRRGHNNNSILDDIVSASILFLSIIYLFSIRFAETARSSVERVAVVYSIYTFPFCWITDASRDRGSRRSWPFSLSRRGVHCCDLSLPFRFSLFLFARVQNQFLLSFIFWQTNNKSKTSKRTKVETIIYTIDQLMGITYVWAGRRCEQTNHKTTGESKNRKKKQLCERMRENENIPDETMCVIIKYSTHDLAYSSASSSLSTTTTTTTTKIEIGATRTRSGRRHHPTFS